MRNRVLKIDKGFAQVVEAPMPTPMNDFIVVKQHYAPNCIEHRVYQTGYFEFHESPVHCGHEGVGEVWDVGPMAKGFEKGDRVIVFQGWPCGHCHVCEGGLSPTHCVDLKYPKHVEAANKSASGGNGFCEYRLVPAAMLHKIPDDLSFKHAAAGNCLIGCTYSAMRDHHIGPEHVCLIGGVGFVGHATLVNLKHRGATIIALGRHEGRMKTATELGVDHIVNPEANDWLDQIKDFTPNGRGVDYAFECSGYPYYQQKCLEAVKHYGTLILLGYAANEGSDLKWALNTEYGLCWGHKTITSHFDVNSNHRTDLIQTLRDPWIQKMVDQLVTHDLPMSRAPEAFELLNQKEAGKVYFRPGE
ncbi:zinc-binding dehydrogenase [Sphingorhabdus sp. EL138]|jgi:threonine dehydrogenase-like Zn-dependent dehydrogenase|uniref:zinc-dependent alcohol dehydrogenase n=1 Tax=Sphingorhabdus sp. EL138 TaxID=2073156 RepID=UPI000D699EBF|nr:zinc-binding dehydrogenase [Sphingorhabdus sp. EL138]